MGGLQRPISDMQVTNSQLTEHNIYYYRTFKQINSLVNPAQPQIRAVMLECVFDITDQYVINMSAHSDRNYTVNW